MEPSAQRVPRQGWLPPEHRLQRGLQILGWSALGILQPILDALGRNAAYRQILPFGWLEWLLLLLLLAVALPLALMGLDALLRFLARFSYGWGQNLILHLLTMLATLSLLRPVMQLAILRDNYIAWLASLIVALGATIGCSLLNQRFRWFREWMAWIAIGAVAFPIVFVLQLTGPWWSTQERQATRVGQPVPVVMVVFDEFSAVPLFTENLQLDAQRFPNLARLAASSTWYRNATSVHPRTHLAVPAILTGRYPQKDQLATLENYPDNLLALLAHSGAYEMFVLEPLTRLCPVREVAPIPPLDWKQRFSHLLRSIVTVYPYLLLPNDVPLDLPTPPPEWYGSSPDQMFDQHNTVGRFAYGWNYDRNLQLEHFLNGLQPGERPRFCFLHVALPHYPWCYLASGNQYLVDPGPSSEPPATVGDLGEDWTQDAAAVLRCEYRYLQQVGYVDRFIGRLLDRLESSGLWHDCLLIVTADHGVSFRPGHSRRIPDSQNFADLMCVPLFVKLPGQTSGAIEDRNVETIDIAPTIAEVLQLTSTGPFDGFSLLKPNQRLRKTFLFESQMTITEPHFPQKIEAIRRHRELFDNLPLDALPSAARLYPEWVGKSVREFQQVSGDIPSLNVTLHPPWDTSRAAAFVPAFLEGTVDAAELMSFQRAVVVAVNGEIVDVCPFHQNHFNQLAFSLLLPEQLAGVAGHAVDLFLITRDGAKLQHIYGWKW